MEAEDIKEIKPASPNFRTELAEELNKLVPEAIADGKVDVKKLQELLDGDVADDSERFGLFWPGKRRAMQAAQEPTTATLKPSKEQSKDWDNTRNVFIEGDNLEVLKVLQKHYHNKIKMIYIDPPYNTGKDFVYPDNYKEGLQSYLEFSKQVDEGGKKLRTNAETEGRYHSNWLNMMYPRLKLARNLLTDDGVIFISIGHQEVAILKELGDEIFGPHNFIYQLAVVNKLNGNDNSSGMMETHEYCLIYAKKYSTFSMGVLPISDEQVNEWEMDDLGWWKNGGSLKATGINAPRAKRPNLFFPVYVSDKLTISLNRDEEHKHEVLPITDGDEVCWTWSRGKFEREKYDVIVKKVKNSYSLYKKQRPALGDLPSKRGKTTFYDPGYSTANSSMDIKKLFNGRKTFDYTKSVVLLKDFISLSNSKNNDIILDFFSGSSTTAHAVMQLNAEDGGNRKHIQVQLPEPTEPDSEAYKTGYKKISDISMERIRRAGEKIKEDYKEEIAKRETPLDVGFRVYKLSDTNFSKWKSTSDIDADKLQQRLLDMRESSDDNATQTDLLTEILLKSGFSLTDKIEQKEIAGLPVWALNDSSFIAYLDEHTKPSLDQLRSITDIEPEKFVILEDAFRGDDELKTNLVQMCKSKSIELWSA